ncbi:hypothetical protein [Spongiactinospora sp. TRM90649]|uniref:hypothetical protein n=1 Tax=Spongiactinospora sp. TRM90649 TaxID=3031114 RepID=UPI0023F8321B|nr:hypothetical protein [Spongiactinospora sp. TRM90649]MDF5757566.1 hypothetical protein [Spongiactinospora sp. TRM90649]
MHSSHAGGAGVPPPHERSPLARFRDGDVEAFIHQTGARISYDASILGVDPRTFELQVRLHLPALSRRALTSWPADRVYEAVRIQALVRAAEIRLGLEDAAYDAHTSLLCNVDKVHRDLTLIRIDGSTSRLRFGEVDPWAGHRVQARMHYLRSERADTVLQFGLFLPGAQMPLTYLAFSPCDRRYMLDALALLGIPAHAGRVLVLTRVHGLPGIPANLMSLTIGRALRELRARGAADNVVTAFNPMLGFSGASFRAAGFVPVASCPVTYSYDAAGFFQTRRTATAPTVQRLETPDNILMVRGVTRTAKRRLADSLTAIHRVPRETYDRREPARQGEIDPADQEWVIRLAGYRGVLQSAWSSRTAHPLYLDGAPPDAAPPRGQCGVASVWLARRLHAERGIAALYCVGSVTFAANDRRAVRHHCWIEVGDPEDPRRVVIDLTADQADDATEPVVFARHADLLARGVSYTPVSRQRLDELPGDRVWRRFLALSDVVDQGGAAGHGDPGQGRTTETGRRRRSRPAIA